MSRQILFVPLHTPSMLEMMPIAQRISDDGQYQPCFFIYRDFPDERIEQIRQNGFTAIGPRLSNQPTREKDNSSSLAENEARTSWWREKVKILARWAQSITITSFVFNLITYYGTLRKARQLLDQQSIAAIIIIGDRHVGWETAVIKAANQDSIPSLIVPYALSDPKGSATFRLRQTENDSQYFAESISGRWVEKKHPNWVFSYNGRRLLYLPTGAALAAQVLGIMPENPWTIGGGAASRMAVESQRLRKMFLDQGIPSEKMVVTGKPTIDQIFQGNQGHMRQTVRDELDIPADRSVILCAVPHLGEHGFLPFSQHLKEMDTLISVLVSQPDVSVVLSLHPKSDPTQYIPIAERHGALIASRRIYDLLPACDIFVAGFSSTIMHAVGVYKPSIVVDFYGLNFTFYNDAPGVIVLKDRENLAVTLQKLFDDRGYYDHLVQEQKRRAAEWIMLDGQCTYRVVDLIYDTINQRVLTNQ